MRIEEEIKQKKFKSEYIKADINVMFSANWISARQSHILKPYDISIQQFNILRILRGQHPKPAPLKLLTERMIDRMSNTSRLVEKLKKKGLVTRQVCETNRRQVDISITEKGLALVEKASELIEGEREQSRNLTDEEIKQLNRLLDKMRGG